MLNFRVFFFSVELQLNFQKYKLTRLVDIICDKMAEGGDNDTSSAQTGQGNMGGGGGAGAGGPNVRGGQNSGTTRLTNASNNNSGDNQPCQC